MRGFVTAKGRDAKAAKITAVLCAALHLDQLSNFDNLDIGSGSGHIAARLAEANRATAADIENQLQVTAPQLQFALLGGDELPFDDRSFDIAVLNFVLMYVPDPLTTLRAVRRALKPDGVCYVALPNRWFPIDPHVHLPMVSYLPEKMYQLIVNRLREAHERIRLFTPRGAEILFERAGFRHQDYTHIILHDPMRFHVEMPLRFPAWQWLARIAPSNIFVHRASHRP